MALPDPEPGMMIQYAYLWARKVAQQAGEKDRPSVILSVAADEEGELVVRVAPVTHTAPINPADGIPIPAETRKRLGLDSREMWLMISEVNEFSWSGFDLRRVPDKFPRSYFYGHVPAKLLNEAATKMSRYEAGDKLKTVPRDTMELKPF